MIIEIDMHKSNVFVTSILILEAKLWLSMVSLASAIPSEYPRK